MRKLVTATLAITILASAWADEPIVIRMMAGPSWGIPPKEATDARSQARRAVFEAFQKKNPDIRVVNAGGLEMKGDFAESGFLMSMAGDTAPDVFYVNFRQYYNYIDQGFCMDLDPLVKQDPSVISRVNPVIEKVLRSYDGKLYALPWYQVANALYYRKDHFVEAGLDPNRPPQNWEEFIEYGRKLVESKSGRWGYSFSAGIAGKGYPWTNFVWQAGGDILKPADRGYMKAAIATPQVATALEFYRRLVNETWTGRDGKTFGPIAGITANQREDIKNGLISMWFSYTNDVMLNTSDLNPALVGFAAMPAGPGGRANEINAGMWSISTLVKDPRKLEACWRFIKFFMGDDAIRITAEKYIELGMGSMVNPVLLKRFGYADLAAAVDPAFVKANEELFTTGHPEPYGRNCQQVYTILDGALDRAKLEPKTPAMVILQSASREMDRKLLGYTPPEVLAKQRVWAIGIMLGLILIGGFVFAWAWKKARGQALAWTKANSSRYNPRTRRFIAICLMPAMLSIFIWAYYPLLRGLVIAFQDYRIIKGSEWVGLDNFIAVFTQPIFWKSLMNSFLYVGLTILIGFLIPIGLAIALNEIPRFKTFFRVIFYLPAMTSAIVVAFMWRQFFDKSDAGLLNTILLPFINLINPLLHTIGVEAIKTSHDWLGDPSLAMFAVVLPGIWAGAGPGSILYLAALKNIPDERYEASDLDGASWIKKIRYITLPGLRPLILINLLGVFIGGFKAMENIFILTGGGPLYSTHTIGLEIWTNAFMFLKFGYATAAAWIMGAILVGFTIMQIRSLTKMKFSAAKL